MSQEKHPPIVPSRREFLKSSTVALGGTALAASIITPVHAAGGETIKVALIGCGARGSGAVVQALSTAGPVQLWAMADAFQNRLDLSRRIIERQLTRQNVSLAEKVNLPQERQFVGLDAYRKAIDSGVDVVILAGPPGFRPQQFDYAIKAGKHVFMEKPVATDPVGVRKVLAVAEEAKQKSLKVGVGLQRHHQPSYLEAMPRIHGGEIGDIHTLRCYWNTGNPAKTPVAKGDSSELEHQVRNWYFFSWLSGDHVCEQHVHNLDACNWVKQAYPIEAQGMGGRQVRTGKQYGDIYDHHAVEFLYADGTKMFSQCRQIPGCASSVMEVAHGSKGVAMLDGMRASLQIDGKPVWQSKQGGSDPYQVEFDALFDAIRNNKPYNEAEYGALSTMTAIMARLATYSGKIIKWDEAFNSNLCITTDAEQWDAEAPLLPLEDGSYPIAVPGVTKMV